MTKDSPIVIERRRKPTSHEINAIPTNGTWYPVEDDVKSVFQLALDSGKESSDLLMYPILLAISPELSDELAQKQLSVLLDSARENIPGTDLGRFKIDISPDTNGNKHLIICHSKRDTLDKIQPFLQSIILDSNNKLLNGKVGVRFPPIPELVK